MRDDLSFIVQGLSRLIEGNVYIKDGDGKYVYCNDSYLKFLRKDGFLKPGRTLVGGYDRDVFPEETWKKFRGNDISVMKTKKEALFFEPNQIDGTYVRHYVSRKLPILDSHGEAVAMIGQSISWSEIPISKGKIVFSVRNIEVLSCVCHGVSVPVIAKILGISKRTVESYIEDLKSKLNFSQRHDLIVLVNKLGLMPMLRLVWDFVSHKYKIIN